MGSPARSSAPALSVAAALCLLPLSASAQAPRGPREDLDVVGAALDRAVRQVSRPGALAFAGRATRAYALPGVGTVFVLPARALPTRRASRPAEPPAGRALADALANLQESLRRVRTPELRAQIERSLEAVREAQAELRSLPRPAVAPVPFELPPVPVELPDMRELAAQVEAQLADQARAMREAQRASRDAQRRFREEWEAEVRALSAQTDAFRVEAEKVREEAERALRNQLGVPWPELGEWPLAPAPPEPAVPPSPVAVPGAPAAPPAPPVAAAPHVPAAPRLPVAPWSLWFEADEGPDVGDADGVVRRVRDAVLGVLESEGERLGRQEAGDAVIVAVDFVPRAGAAAARTLVVRARRKDIQERRAGRIAPEEFRRRVEATEY